MKIFLMLRLASTVFLFFCFEAVGQLKQRLNTAIEKIEPKCIEWRRHIHQYPELGNREINTAKFIADHLRKLGLDVKENIAKTGVVGILRGAKPGPCVALRADMDGLPLTERVNLPFASKEKTIYNNEQVGVMHACGHDAHVAIMMSVAEILSGIKSELKGTVKFIFQPAEEGPPEGETGGAPLMVKEGVMENPKVDVIFGLHIQSRVEAGTIEYKPGAFMAATDFFSINVKGKASHASQPWLGIDPISVSAQIINSIQTIVSRQSELTKAPVVISIGKIQGGVRNNIISENCMMLGTIRTLDTAMRTIVLQKLRLTIAKIAEASGAEADIVINERTLVNYNDPELVKKMLPSLQAAIGTANVKEREWVTGGEDFSYFGTRAPSFFFYLGGMPKGSDPEKAPPHHTPDFYIDEAGMKTGVQAFCQLVTDYLGMK